MGERIDVAGALGGYLDPDCARVQPARLVQGLAGVDRGLGVTVHEQTRVISIEPGQAVTPYGVVRAPYVSAAWRASRPGWRDSGARCCR